MLEFGENKSIDVVCLGRAGIDLNAAQMNVPMEENMTFRKTVGGSPANIAVACSKYNLKVGFIGRVSDDQHGRYIRSYFESKGINTESLITDQDGGMIGLAFTEIKSPKDSSYILHRDNVADLNLSVDDIDEEYIRNTKLLVVSGTALSKSPSREAVFAALEYAEKHDTRVMLDIDYRNYTWKSAVESGIYLSLCAEKCDIIVGTREEFDMLEMFSNPGNREDALTAGKWFGYKARVVIVKHGKDGSFAYSSDGSVTEGAVFPVTPLKTMGAGDSYAGGLIFGMLDGRTISEAMEIGAGAAAIVVQSPDCSESMPSLQEVRDFIDGYRSGL
ncbi:MAG: 5-dehydro-2-deoxygluconokinase [Spirochaetales bacterium]|uniref:5-dehydro-2-deoxygluconokinase n=1 Tax=Candidatus Thalassospirochaeta sargassi TaxID=3119039 RepID=A0AAJ1MIN7_9SPIO|nr:5-dehydro-2-deoxygluconokinase [Spirochaetales bacterium]